MRAQEPPGPVDTCSVRSRRFVAALGSGVLAALAVLPLARSAPAAESASYVVSVYTGTVSGVIVGRDYAYAINEPESRIEVLSFALGELESPIPLSHEPSYLELSPDERTLYALSLEGNGITVVDLARRQEVRYISLARDGFQARGLAVTSAGFALVTGIGLAPDVNASHLLQVDLATGAVRERVDVPAFEGGNGSYTISSSGDHTRIGLGNLNVRFGAIATFDVATDSFDQARSFLPVGSISLDTDGDTLVVGTPWGTGSVLERDLSLRTSLPSTAILNGAGTIGYHAVGNTIDVLDARTGQLLGTLAVPGGGQVRSNMDVSEDGTRLVALTDFTNFAVRPAAESVQRGPYSLWALPGGGYDGVATWVGVVNDPRASGGQQPTNYLAGQYFGFANSPAIGAVALVTEATGKYAVVSVAGPDGAPRTAAVRFPWSAGGHYYLLVNQVAPGTLGAWVYDNTAGVWAGIGLLAVPAEWGKLGSHIVTGLAAYGPTAGLCAAYPRFEIVVHPPVGYVGTAPSTATLSGTGQNPGDCPAQITAESGGWTRYGVGASGPTG